jgi:hypothetical protein
MLREGGSTWYRDTLMDVKMAFSRLTCDERECLRNKLLLNNKNNASPRRGSTSIHQEITQLFLQQLPKHGRRDLTKKIRQHYQSRKISSQSVLGEYDLSIQDFYLLFWGEGRKIQSDLLKKEKKRKNDDDNDNDSRDSDKDNIDNRNKNSGGILPSSTQWIIIDQFLQRAMQSLIDITMPMERIVP